MIYHDHTYAPLDVFDWCEIISQESKRVAGKKTNGEDKHPTQEEIAIKLGISRGYVANFDAIATNLSSSVYELCKSHQINRGDQEPQFQFTEGWFRNSGLCGLYIIYDNFKKDLRPYPSEWYNSRKEYLSLYLYIAVTFISIRI